MKIEKAYAIYTGGNIWLFHGKLKNGNYFLMDDDGWTQILDADPSDFDESLFYEWQEKHLIKELKGKKRIKFCDKVLDYLEENPSGGITELEIEVYRTYFRNDSFQVERR